MSESSGWPTCSRGIRFYIVPSKRNVCLRMPECQNQDSTLAAVGLTLLECTCGHPGPQGRCWKLLPSSRSSAWGTCLLPFMGWRGTWSRLSPMKSQGTDPQRQKQKHTERRLKVGQSFKRTSPLGT